MNIATFVRKNRPKRFTPKPYYSPSENSLACFFEDEPCYVSNVDRFLALYRADRGEGRVVGCKIMGVSVLQRHLGEFGVLAKGPRVPMTVFLLMAMAHAMEDDRVQYRKVRALLRHVAATVDCRKFRKKK